MYVSAKRKYKLNSEKKIFYTYIPAQDRCVYSDDSKSGLEEKLFKIKNVFIIRNRERVPKPMLRVELEPEM